MTEGWRKVDADKPAPLFLSYIKPHRPVMSQRLAHWVKDLLKEARVDTEIFKAHSVRGASTSAALKKRLHIKDILDTANWSQESTFQKFYCQSMHLLRKFLATRRLCPHSGQSNCYKDIVYAYMHVNIHYMNHVAVD